MHKGIQRIHFTVRQYLASQTYHILFCPFSILMFHALQRNNTFAIIAESEKGSGFGNSGVRECNCITALSIICQENKLNFTSLNKFLANEGKN